MEEKVLRCKVADNHDHGSDYFPIITTLDLKPERMEEAPIYNFDRTNWDLLKAKIIEFLPSITDEPTSPPMVDQTNWQRISRRHLEKAIEYSTPRRRICLFSKRWWTEKLTKARKETNKARNRFKRTSDAGHQRDIERQREGIQRNDQEEQEEHMEEICERG